MKPHVLCAFVLNSAIPLFAQSDNLTVFGSVRDYSTQATLSSGYIAVNDADEVDSTLSVNTDETGRYELVLSPDRSYSIVYAAPGKLSKTFKIETVGPTSEQWKEGFRMNMDVALMDTIPGLDVAVLAEPLGIARWHKGRASFLWDTRYMKKMKPRHEFFMRAYEKARMKRQ